MAPEPAVDPAGAVLGVVQLVQRACGRIDHESMAIPACVLTALDWRVGPERVRAGVAFACVLERDIDEGMPGRDDRVGHAVRVRRVARRAEVRDADWWSPHSCWPATARSACSRAGWRCSCSRRCRPETSGNSPAPGSGVPADAFVPSRPPYHTITNRPQATLFPRRERHAPMIPSRPLSPLLCLYLHTTMGQWEQHKPVSERFGWLADLPVGPKSAMHLDETRQLCNGDTECGSLWTREEWT